MPNQKQYNESFRPIGSPDTLQLGNIKTNNNLAKLGQAVGGLADSYKGLQARKEDVILKESDYDSSRAESFYKIEQNDIIEEYKRNPSPTSKDKAKSDFKLLRQKHVVGIRHDEGKKLFNDSVDLYDEQAFSAVNRVEFNKETDLAFTSLNALGDLTNRSMEGKSAKDKMALVDAYNQNVSAMERSGYMDTSKGEQIKREMVRQAANLHVSEMNIDEIVDMVKPVYDVDGSSSGVKLMAEVRKNYGKKADVLPKDYLPKMTMMESSLDQNAQAPTSSAGGLHQFTDATAKQYGVKDRFNPVDSTNGAISFALDNIKSLKKRLKRNPTGGELYLAHQQGATGAGVLLANPKKLAVDVLTDVYGSKAKASKALGNNLGNDTMTAKDFTDKWIKRYDDKVVVDSSVDVYEATGGLTDYASIAVRTSALNRANKEIKERNVDYLVEKIKMGNSTSWLADTQEIENPEIKKEVHTRIKAEIAIKNEIEKAETQKTLMDGVDASNGVLKDEEDNDVSYAEWRATNIEKVKKLTPSQQQTMDENYQNTLNNRAVNEKVATENFYNFIDAISKNPDKEWLEIDWVKTRNILGKNGEEKLRGMYDEWQDGNKDVFYSARDKSQTLRNLEFKLDLSDNKSKKANLAYIFDDIVRSESNAKGRDLTLTEMRAIGENLSREIVIENPYWFDTKTDVFNEMVKDASDMTDMQKDETRLRVAGVESGKQPNTQQLQTMGLMSDFELMEEYNNNLLESK